MGYAFISHSSKDIEAANAVKAILERNGIETWMSEYDIPAGVKYSDELVDAIENCACFVLLLSDAAQKSSDILNEVNLANHFDKPKIPVQLEDIELSRSFMYYILAAQIVSINAIDESSSEMQKIIKAVFEHTNNDETEDVSQATSPIIFDPAEEMSIFERIANLERVIREHPHGLKNRSFYFSDLCKQYARVGSFYLENSKLSESEFYYLLAAKGYAKLVNKSIKPHNRRRFSRDLAYCYIHIGDVYRKMGNHQKAEEHYALAQSVFEEFSQNLQKRFFSDEISICSERLGDFYAESNQTQKAEEYYLKAIGAKNNASYNEKIGDFYRKNNRPIKAEEHYLIAIKTSNPASSNEKLGDLYRENGRLKDAEEYYFKAICRLENYADSCNHTGDYYYEKGFVKNSESSYMQANETRKELATIFNKLSNLYKGNEQPQKSEEYSTKAADANEEYLVSSIELYEKLAGDNPDKYTGDLASSYFDYAKSINDDVYYEKAYNLAKTVMNDPRCQKIVEELKDVFS